MRTVQIISVNHLSHTPDEYRSLEISDTVKSELVHFMKQTLKVEGYIFLTTCNRIEIYFEAEDDHRFDIIQKWLELTNNKDSIDKNSFKTYFGNEIAMRYFLGLSAGFRSAIFGDDQIHTQLKNAFEKGRAENALSTLLERAYQSIMRCHKSICKETNYRKNTVSLAYHSLRSITNVIPKQDLKNRTILIIGAGEMAKQVVKYLPKFKFKEINLTNRTKSKALELSAGKAINVIDYGTIDTSQYDIIVSCTEQGSELIDDFSNLNYYIDLSTNSSFLENIEIPHIMLHELEQYINTQHKKRMLCIALVKRILVHHVNDYTHWVLEWKHRRLTQAIRA